MKIYTKKGDKGTTQLLGGKLVPKNHIKLECYGAIDELNAFIGNIYDDKVSDLEKKDLLKIQNQLFNLGSCIAFDGEKEKIKLPQITEKDIVMLEERIDNIAISLPSLKNFILPCGVSAVSKCHIARTVCRRAERNLVSLSNEENVNPLYLKYLNRLSDYLFMLGRWILAENNINAIEWEKD